MESGLSQKVTTWLQEQGYPLEMETAQAARQVGFDVSQSDYYVDPETEDSREIDLVVSTSTYKSEFSLSYNLFIECKSGKSKPWLIFADPNEISSQEPIYNPIRNTHIGNKYADRMLSQCAIDGTINNMYPRIDTEPVIGYGMTRAFTTGEDIPYKAMVGACKAALYHTDKFGEPFLSTPFLVSIPVIVLNAPLLTVTYSSKSDELEVREVEYGVIYWKQLVGGRSRIGIYVVRNTALRQFFETCKKASDWWINTSEENLNSIHTDLGGTSK